LGALALAGCGGSKSTSAASTSTASVTVPPITTTAPKTRTATTVTLTKTAPTPKTTTKSKTATTGSINVRVPARFTILPTGSVTPPTVTIPADLPVELIVVSNGQPHHITLRATTLAVKGHAQAEALIDGLKPGSYPLKIDGVPKATLTIGGSPGP
jgi:hypothetical protein